MKTGLVSSIVAIAFFAVFVASASAAQTRPYTGVSFGPDGVGGSESFESIQSVAVDQSTGDVYVYDSGEGKIYKFDSPGEPDDFSALGTNVIEQKPLPAPNSLASPHPYNPPRYRSPGREGSRDHLGLGARCSWSAIGEELS